MVTLDQWSLHFQSDEVSIQIPLERLVARVRESAEPEVVLTDAGEPNLEIVAADLELLECISVPALASARETWQRTLSRRELKRRIWILAGFLGACVAITMLVSLALSFMVRAIVARIPPEWDAEFGASVISEEMQASTFVTNTSVAAKLESFAEPLLAVLPQSTNGHQFHLILDPDPNAFALPGGHILVTSGLLELADQPEELLAVIAHEVAHVSERHVYRNIVSTSGPLMVCSLFFGGKGGIGNLMSGSAALMIGAGFSQDYETEADKVGWDYLVAANIDPQGMIRVFRKMATLESNSPTTDVTPEAFRSHPALEKRITRLERRWARLPRKTGFIELPQLEIRESELTDSP